MRRDVKAEAVGRWPGILRALGVDAKVLNGKHQACPMCGGSDRFRFDDKDGRGTYYCSQCGPGDGWELLMRWKAVEFKEAVRLVEGVIGTAQSERRQEPRDVESKRKALNATWGRSEAGGEVAAYLEGRGLRTVPPTLRWVAEMRYYDSGAAVGTYGAMVAKIVDVDGAPASLHCTYIHQGKKANVPSPKKIMPAVAPINGAAVRLFPAAEKIAVAEGIESALAAHELFGLPAWATVSANGMETLEVPEVVKAVLIAADNDANLTGQRAAYVLGHRLARAGLAVSVLVPPKIGDWLDVLNNQATPEMDAYATKMRELFGEVTMEWASENGIEKGRKFTDYTAEVQPVVLPERFR